MSESKIDFEIEPAWTKPYVTSKVVMHEGVARPDMQPMAFGEFRNGEWQAVIEDPDDLLYTGPDLHGKGELDCLSPEMHRWADHWGLGTYWCTPCAVNEGAAVGINYPPTTERAAKALAYDRAKFSAKAMKAATS